MKQQACDGATRIERRIRAHWRAQAVIMAALTGRIAPTWTQRKAIASYLAWCRS